MSKSVEPTPAKNGHGGRRAGAGRKPGPGPRRHHHRSRAAHDGSVPVQVAMRVTAEVARLPRRTAYEALRLAMVTTAGRENFQVVHLWMARSHIYLLCEADDRMALSSGIRALGVSAARRLNLAIGEQLGDERLGRVFVDRYHVTPIATPRQAKEALANVWPKAYEPLPAVIPRTMLLARGRVAGA